MGVEGRQILILPQAPKWLQPTSCWSQTVQWSKQHPLTYSLCSRDRCNLRRLVFISSHFGEHTNLFIFTPFLTQHYDAHWTFGCCCINSHERLCIMFYILGTTAIFSTHLERCNTGETARWGNFSVSSTMEKKFKKAKSSTRNKKRVSRVF